MNKSKYIISLLSLATLVSGCQKNNPDGVSVKEDQIVMFSPCLHVGEEIGTKGTIISGTSYGTAPFTASAWSGTTNKFPYTTVKQFTHTGGSGHTYWSTCDASGKMVEHLWKKDETLTFYAYSNLPTTTGAATMANTSSSSQTLTYDVTKVTTASAQTDILLGYYSGTGQTPADAGKTGTDWVGHFAPINFRHPLTAVKFKKGTIDGWTTGDKITKIEIAGVYASGVCTDNGSFAWTPGSTTTTVSMSNTDGLAIDGTSSLVGEPFLLIPQNLASKSYSLTLVLTIGGNSYTASAPLSEENLEAGKYYVYTFDYNPGKMTGLVVTVEDWGVVYSDDAGTVDYFTAKFD